MRCRSLSVRSVQSALCVAFFAVIGCAPGAADELGTSEEAMVAPMSLRGVNLASAEFAVSSDGTGAVPGTHGVEYIYPDPTYASGYTSLDYFIGKGMTAFRLPFRWERLQRTRRQAFDATELTRLRTSVNRITGRGAWVILDPHNYARYGTALIGSSTVPNADFADLWSRLATEFKGNPRVVFGLMNEPYDLPTEQWVGSANAAISAIRATGATNLVLVPGNAWTGAHSWLQSWYGTANGTALLNIQDVGNNVAFEVHQYLDADFSGASSGCVSATIGSEKMRDFTQWLRTHGKKGFLGEFGTGSSATCLAAIDNILDHMEANQDVYLGWTWWAAGPWWGDYFMSLEPSGSTDKPQMDALEPHLGPVSAPPPPSCTDGVKNGAETGVDCGGSCNACPTTTCQVTTYQAETMLHSTGSAITGGWALWRNGYISSSHVFGTGTTRITVTARGTSAGGVGPSMSVSVGGVRIGTVSVNATTWTTYAFSFAATSGTQEVRVSFTNDLLLNGEDRNLYLDKVTVGCPSTCVAKTYQAESMFQSTGGATLDGWNLWSDGYLSTQHTFVSGTTPITVRAKGTVAAGVWPRMTLSIGGVVVGTQTVSATAWTAYRFTAGTSAGAPELRVTFDNDHYENGEDRNLLVDNVVVGCP